MPPYSRVVSIYERLIVLSNSAITREVYAMFGPTVSTPPPVLREACELLVKSGEWQRALVVAHALPDAAGKVLAASLGFQTTSKDSVCHLPPNHAQTEKTEAMGKDEDEKVAAALREAPTEELLRMAFALQRRTGPRSSDAAAEETEAIGKDAAVLYESQRRIFLELQRRRRYKELAQCVATWRAKSLFPPRNPSPTAHASVRFHAEDALRDLFFGPAPRCEAWDEALHDCPELFLRVLRDPSAAVRFVRKAGLATSIELVSRLLRDAPTDWDTVAALFIALGPQLSDETAAAKVDLLHALLKAVRKESTRNKSTAICATTEALCASVTHRHEAQARFIGLFLFTEVAIALCDCGAGVPDALLQCILLCLGDSQRVEWTEHMNRPRNNTHGMERESLAAMAVQLPEERWSHALRVIQACDAQGTVTVGPTHLRCLLSGLQSVSIPRTWLTALRAAQCMMEKYKIQPDEATVQKIMLNLHASSWEKSFEVLHMYEQKRVAPPPSILRDIHVVAMKHASLDVVLRVMEQLKACGPQHVRFMNHLYCLRAYGCAGKWNEAATLFQQLKNIPNFVGESAYNEVTVAVPVMGMMERQRWPEVRRFLQVVSRTCGEEMTQEGWLVVLAAELLGTVHLDDAAATASFLNRYAGRDEDEKGLKTMIEDHKINREKHFALIDPPFQVAELGAIVAKSAELQTLLGMESLNAPIRLVFDFLAVDVGRRPDAEHMGPITRGSSDRPRLYIPQRHVRQQREWFAVALGKMVRREETIFGASAQRIVARAMTKLGVGPDYMKAALL